MASCTHLTAYKSNHGTDPYQRLHRALLSSSSAQARCKSGGLLKCQKCQSSVKRHIHICMFCVHFACKPAGHFAQHVKERGHHLSVEAAYGNIYCHLCKDFVYDSDFENLNDRCWNRFQKWAGLGVRHRPWTASPDEKALLQKHKKRKGFPCNTTFGLRGLVNLGNTCFMSVILQSLIHTPLLRDYFLSDRHVCSMGNGNNSGGSSSNSSTVDGGSGSDQCLVCEMSRLFQEFYSGAKSPLVPHVLLHMTWTQAHHLAGYEQQDAHEFFIATLNLLHRHLIRRPDMNSSNCDCIVDTVFTGKLQSDVVCQSCKNVSTTIDPFWDISLDLPNVVNQPQPLSLHDCLERFTKPEHLGSAAKIKCSICKSYQESTKQLTMKKLPLVASFHLKRFEHSTRLHKKITTRVNFPEFLDMSPFVSHIRNNESSTSSENYESPVRNNVYTLFAVINHVGNMEAGHYTSFIRQHRDKWYVCNDHQIVPSSIKDVLDSEGYLLFYHKQKLEYK